MKKNEKKKHYRSVTSLIISQCFVKIFGLMYKLYLANKDGFGDAGNAIYNAGFQIYALLLTISSVGVPNAVAKLIAEKKYENSNEIGFILKTALILFFIIGIFFSVLLAVLAGIISKNVINMEETKFTIVALAPAIFNVCLISVYRGFYNGTSKIEISAKSQTIEQIYKTIFTILLVEIFYYINGKCTLILAIVANFATTLATFSCLVYLERKCDIRLSDYKFSKTIAMRVLKISIPISMSAILASLNRIIDSATVVRFLKGNVGEFNARIQYGILSGKVDVLATVPVSFVIAISTTIIPKIVGLISKNQIKKATYVIESYMQYTVILVLPIAASMYVFSDTIMNTLFNSTSGSVLLKISTLSIVFISLEQIIHSALQALGKTLIPAMSIGCGVAIKLIFNIVFLSNRSIPIISGINGVCIATLICHVVTFFISYTYLHRALESKIYLNKILIKPTFLAVIMIIFLKIGKNICINLINEKLAAILTCIIAVYAYLCGIYKVGFLKKDDQETLSFLSNFIKFAKK